LTGANLEGAIMPGESERSEVKTHSSTDDTLTLTTDASLVRDDRRS
jgi:hypothetical protein